MPSPLDWQLEAHLRERFASVLDEYILNPDDIGFAVAELLDALKEELDRGPT